MKVGPFRREGSSEKAVLLGFPRRGGGLRDAHFLARRLVSGLGLPDVGRLFRLLSRSVPHVELRFSRLRLAVFSAGRRGADLPLLHGRDEPFLSGDDPGKMVFRKVCPQGELPAHRRRLSAFRRRGAFLGRALFADVLGDASRFHAEAMAVADPGGLRAGADRSAVHRLLGYPQQSAGHRRSPLAAVAPVRSRGAADHAVDPARHPVLSLRIQGVCECGGQTVPRDVRHGGHGRGGALRAR